MQLYFFLKLSKSNLIGIYIYILNLSEVGVLKVKRCIIAIYSKVTSQSINVIEI